MEIKITLKKLGFSNKEIDVYISCLQLGPATMTEIATKANIKRPTTYLIISALIKHGLMSIYRCQHKTLYVAERPKKILSLLRQQEHELERALPELEVLYNCRKNKPKVLVYEGIEGVRTVYDEIYSSLNKKEEALFFTSIADLHKYASFAIDYFISRLTKIKQYKIRELNTHSKAAIEYARNIKNRQSPNHYIKNSVSQFPFTNDTVIFSNKVVFFSLKKDIFVTIIESEDISSTMRSLFEIAWSGTH